MKVAKGKDVTNAKMKEWIRCVLVLTNAKCAKIKTFVKNVGELGYYILKKQAVIKHVNIAIRHILKNPKRKKKEDVSIVKLILILLNILLIINAILKNHHSNIQL